ncbi:uncharacterized protein N7459_004986 [Penicillium hispanicum]|uniref:uncharacterized protein n=1 Tax=Penicillium hispanicum TaxID=1080232 RepID=UPI002541768C|nr:uncharacterized protein N7459_004986 [Penicillium hispanicum]KAJ5585186.1 hypothetical protein N7459_004986 [Penicillium hispanicum]
MPLVRKRQAANPDPADSDESTPETTTNMRRQRPRGGTASPAGEAPDSEDSGAGAPSSTDAMVKKMVRLALASEYSRLPIRRTDISAKVLGEQGSRQFKLVFDSAQRELRQRFGMEMTELPAREKVTITQRRAAQKTDKPSSTNKSWVLTTTLPAAYRNPDVLVPTKAPSSATESTYTAIYSFVIAVVLLNGGSLVEQKLQRYLARMNADTYTPIDRTDKFLQRLCKEGYLVKTRQVDGGEEVIEYMVGPRGKVEVGSSGVAGLVREVYGRAEGDGELTQAEREEREEFEVRLRRSLGIVNVRQAGRETEQETPSNGQNEEVDGRRSEGPRRSSRHAAVAAEEEDEDDDDEEEEESD